MAMYIDFFGFRDKPFRLTPESAAFYCSAPHDRAMTMLEYGINSRKGLMLLHGMPGSGKTTLCFLLRETLVNCNVTYIPKAADGDLLLRICKGFGLSPDVNSTENEYFGILIDFFVSEYKNGKNNLIIIDDADEYSIDTFQLIEPLAEVEIEQCKLVQILVVGTQELCSKLMYGGIKSLGERVLSVTELNLLSLHDTASYLQHRLKYAKVTDPELLKRTAVVEIFRYSHGLPLEINLVADKAFEAAAIRKDKKVGPKHVKQAIKHIAGIREPLKVYTIAQYIIPMLLVLVVLLVGLQVKTWLDMKDIEKQYAETVHLPTSIQQAPSIEETPETEYIEAIHEQVSETEQVTALEPEPAPEPIVTTAEAVATPEPVITPPASAQPVAAAGTRYGCVTAQSGLNLRAVPSPAGRVVTGLMYGQKVILLEERENWWLVDADGSEGFLFANYVKEIAENESCD